MKGKGSEKGRQYLKLGMKVPLNKERREEKRRQYRKLDSMKGKGKIGGRRTCADMRR
jgi:hypothetical protein